ncbi:MAG: exodeoxyribonuclease VII small subunit [Planctomycetota bacterium]
MTEPTPSSSTPADAAPADRPFDETMGEVESIIESIESGELGLEDSIKAYERAAGLMKKCRTMLHAAELKVEEINALLRDDQDQADPMTKD